MGAYALMWSDAATAAFVTAPRQEQRKLAVALDRLKANPFRPGDLQERDAQGRINEMLIAGDWLRTYWLDHAAKEARIVRLEQIEE